MLLLAAVTPTLGACSTLTPGLTSKGALDAFQPIRGSAADTCETQRQVSEHNSRYETLKTGKEVVFKAHCDKAPQRVASTATPKS